MLVKVEVCWKSQVSATLSNRCLGKLVRLITDLMVNFGRPYGRSYCESVLCSTVLVWLSHSFSSTVLIALVYCCFHLLVRMCTGICLVWNVFTYLEYFIWQLLYQERVFTNSTWCIPVTIYWCTVIINSLG